MKKKRKTVICEFEIDFKQPFCGPSSVSNDNMISAYVRSENGWGKGQVFGLK